MRRAANITKDIYKEISGHITPGKTEYELAEHIDSIIKKRGLRRSFRTIVASGPNAAKPHAMVTKRRIKKGDTVVVDFGVIYNGYHSDMTRTVIIGKSSKEMKRFYRVVENAQKLAIKKLRPGLRISELVESVHNYIRKRGYGRYILHSLGHGIGKRIHEPPKLSEKNREVLQDNMVITIEPGLYVKGRYGVRIEDMVLILNGKISILTR